jgi:predicted nucleic acid-binding protein
MCFRDASETEKQPLAERWLKELWQARTGRTSVQVLNEFYVAVTQKLKPGMLIERAWGVQERHELSWWDSLVVAAAQVSRASVLLTEDLQDGRVFGGVEIVNPFLHLERLPHPPS